MCDRDETANNCIHEILKTILVLQREANVTDCCLDTCDKKCLGCTPSVCFFNTRPITLYTCGCCNTALQIPVSRIPNETTTSNVFRIEKLDAVIKNCNFLFNLPIMIIAQNWKNLVCNLPNVNVINYENKLGITGARRELRKKFLESEYDYIVMLDDDAKLIGTPEDARRYIHQIHEHPGK